MAVWNTLPTSSDAIRRPSNTAARTWPNCLRTRPKAESEKKGGRKTASVACPELEDNLREVVREHTAGDPMQEDVIWTYLSPPEIAVLVPSTIEVLHAGDRLAVLADGSIQIAT